MCFIFFPELSIWDIIVRAGACHDNSYHSYLVYVDAGTTDGQRSLGFGTSFQLHQKG